MPVTTGPAHKVCDAQPPRINNARRPPTNRPARMNDLNIDQVFHVSTGLSSLHVSRTSARHAASAGVRGRRCARMWQPRQTVSRLSARSSEGSPFAWCASSRPARPHRWQRHPSRSSTARRSRTQGRPVLRDRMPGTPPRRQPGTLGHRQQRGHRHIIPRGPLPSGRTPLDDPLRAHRVGDCPSVRERLPDQQRPARVHPASIATRNPEDPGATPSYRVQRQVSPRRRCRRSPPAAPWPAGRCRRWRAPAAGRRRSTRGTRRSSRCSRDRGRPGRC